MNASLHLRPFGKSLPSPVSRFLLYVMGVTQGASQLCWSWAPPGFWWSGMGLPCGGSVLGLQEPTGGAQGTVTVQTPGAIYGGTSWWDHSGGHKRPSAEAGAGGGVFLGETADLEFLDLIRKQLGCIQGGVAWGRTEPPGHGPTLQKKAWRGAGESDLAKTQNSTRQPLSGPAPKRHLIPRSDTCAGIHMSPLHLSGDRAGPTFTLKPSQQQLFWGSLSAVSPGAHVFTILSGNLLPSMENRSVILYQLGQPACLTQSPPLFCSPSPAVIYETRDSTSFSYVPSSRPARGGAPQLAPHSTSCLCLESPGDRFPISMGQLLTDKGPYQLLVTVQAPQ